MSEDKVKTAIIEYLSCELNERSLVLYEVNGNPEKRRRRINELAHHLYKRMNNLSRTELYRKITDL
jgi:hypothetical protein